MESRLDQFIHRLTANQSHFSLNLKGILSEQLDVVTFKSQGFGLSDHYHFTVKVYSKCLLDNQKLLGTVAKLGMQYLSLIEQSFEGIISKLNLIYSNRSGYYQYELVLSSPLYLLTQTVQTRIFSKKTLKEILQAIFNQYPLLKHSWKIISEPSAKEVIPFVMQKQEKDFDFLLRLLSRFGLVYTLEKNSLQKIIIYKIGEYPITGRHQCLDYITEKGMNARKEVILDWSHCLQVTPATVEVDQYLYDQAKIGYATDKVSTSEPRFARGQVFLPCSDVEKIEENNRASNLLIQHLDANREYIKAKTTAEGLMVGQVLSINNPVSKQLMGSYLIIGIDHQGNQEYLYDKTRLQGRHGNRSAIYENTIFLIPATLQYYVYRPWNVENGLGLHLARVCSLKKTLDYKPEDEYAFLNKDGLYHVHFSFDLSNKTPKESSIPLRKVEPVVIKEGGSHGTLGKDTSVAISFQNAHWHRPVIAGSLQNEIPSHVNYINPSTHSIKSRRCNVLNMDDTKDNESITLSTEDSTNYFKLDGKKDLHEIKSKTQGDLYLYAKDDHLYETEQEIVNEIGNTGHYVVGQHRSIEIKEHDCSMQSRSMDWISQKDMRFKVDGRTEFNIAGKTFLQVANQLDIKNHNSVLHSVDSNLTINFHQHGKILTHQEGDLTLRCGESEISIDRHGTLRMSSNTVNLCAPHIIQTMPSEGNNHADSSRSYHPHLLGVQKVYGAHPNKPDEIQCKERYLEGASEVTETQQKQVNPMFLNEGFQSQTVQVNDAAYCFKLRLRFTHGLPLAIKTPVEMLFEPTQRKIKFHCDQKGASVYINISPDEYEGYLLLYQFDTLTLKDQFPTCQNRICFKDLVEQKHVALEKADILTIKVLPPSIWIDINDRKTKTNIFSDEQIQYFHEIEHQAYIFLHGYNSANANKGQYNLWEAHSIIRDNLSYQFDSQKNNLTNRDFLKKIMSRKPGKTYWTDLDNLAQVWEDFPVDKKLPLDIEKAFKSRFYDTFCQTKSKYYTEYETSLNGSGFFKDLYQIEYRLNSKMGYLNKGWDGYRRIIGLQWQNSFLEGRRMTSQLRSRLDKTIQMASSFLEKMILELQKNHIKVHLIGHSLGCQVIEACLSEYTTTIGTSQLGDIFLFKEETIDQCFSTLK